MSPHGRVEVAMPTAAQVPGSNVPAHRWALSSRLRGAIVAIVIAVVSLVGSLVLLRPGEHHERQGQRDNLSRAPDQRANQPVLWLQLGSSPRAGDLRLAASTARVVVLNAWELSALRELNPEITVLVYKDLSSTRSYQGTVVHGKDATLLPTGIGYVYANTKHPEWFATDTSVERIEWRDYPGTWQMAVWNRSYQRAWTAAVVGEVIAKHWNVVVADNALLTLRHYSGKQLGGGNSDATLADGVEQIVEQAGTALKQRGLLLVPNVGDARLRPGRWQTLAKYGGGLEEQFLHFSADANRGFLGDPASRCAVNASLTSGSDWSLQAAEVGSAGLVLVHTQAQLTDRRSFLYGYASFLYGYARFLVAGGGSSAFSPTPPDDRYTRLIVQTEQTWPIPVTPAPIRRTGSLRHRWFSTVFAAANPSPSVTMQVSLPFAMTDGSGKDVTSVTLGPHTCIVLKRPASEQPYALEPPVSCAPAPSSDQT